MSKRRKNPCANCGYEQELLHSYPLDGASYALCLACFKNASEGKLRRAPSRVK